MTKEERYAKKMAKYEANRAKKEQRAKEQAEKMEAKMNQKRLVSDKIADIIRTVLEVFGIYNENSKGVIMDCHDGKPHCILFKDLSMPTGDPESNSVYGEICDKISGLLPGEWDSTVLKRGWVFYVPSNIAGDFSPIERTWISHMDTDVIGAKAA